MDIHKNARSCPASRLLLIQRVLGGICAAEAAQAAGVSRRTVWKWVRRYREEGEAGIGDRSSRPLRMPRQVSSRQRDRMVELRRQRCTGLQIAQRLHLSPATVARYLKRSGLSRLKNLEPKQPIRRYEKQRPGELVHLDIKKLGRIRGIGHRITGDRTRRFRGSGWEFVHVAIDDASRLSYVEILKDEKACSSVAFLQRATAWYLSQGIAVERLLTDNGSGYVSHLFAAACRSLDLRHSFTRPYRPRTNGKAERFIQTLLREWAYRRPYKTSYQRQRRLGSYLQHYNLFRPHAGLNRKTPISRLRTVNNLLRNDN